MNNISKSFHAKNKLLWELYVSYFKGKKINEEFERKKNKNPQVFSRENKY